VHAFGARAATQRIVKDDQGSGPVWLRVSHAPRFSWIEPRAAAPDTPPSKKAVRDVTEIRRWEAPMQIGDRRVKVIGVVEWRPALRTGSPRRASVESEAVQGAFLR
jgi:hypothetical protein